MRKVPRRKASKAIFDQPLGALQIFLVADLESEIAQTKSITASC